MVLILRWCRTSIFFCSSRVRATLFLSVFPMLAVSETLNIYAGDQVVKPVTTVINATAPFINNFNVTPVQLTLATLYFNAYCGPGIECHIPAHLIP